MLGFEHGLKRAFSATVGGLVIVMLLSALSRSSHIDSSQVGMIKLLMVANGVFAVLSARYWGNKYLLGWFFGFLISAGAGLVNIGDLTIYLVISGLVFFARIAGYLRI